MKLSKRLTTIADMIEDNSKVYDIGCDHAYLDMYLVTTRHNITCIAIDNKKSIIDDLQEKLKNIHLTEKVVAIFNNGLDNLIVDKESIIVLAGLGTNTILKIINKKNINNVIIQSNDDVFELRRMMNRKHFYILDENIVYEKNKYYIVIRFKKGFRVYSTKKLFLGPILLRKKDSLYNSYLKERKKYYEDLLDALPTGCLVRKNRIKRYLRYLKKALI